FHEEQVVLGVDPDEPEVPGGHGLVAVAPGHADAALGPAAAAVGGVGGDAAPLPVALLDAVAAAQALEVVPLHHAGGAAALGLAGDVHGLDLLEDLLDAEQLPDLDLVVWPVEAVLADVPLRPSGGLWPACAAGRP